MNLKRVSSLVASSLPLFFSLFAACYAPSDESEAPGEESVGAAAQAVVSSGKALQISGGQISTLALMVDGTISSWGDNSHGQLGYTTTGPQTTPAPISALSGFKAVSAGADASYSLALKSDGTLWAWGSNADGQLGIGVPTAGDQLTPAQISGLSGVMAVSAAHYHAHAVKSDGTVSSWGVNSHGQLGIGTTGGSYDAPMAVQTLLGGVLVPLSGVAAVAGGNDHALALKSDGTVWAWGWNNHGEVGNGNTVTQGAAVEVMVGSAPLAGITAIAVGATSTSSFALASDGTVWAWGDNGNGQMGNGTSGGDQYTPAQVMVGGAPLSGITAVVPFHYSVLALKQDGTVWAWGNNDSNCELARTGGPTSTPQQISGLSGVIALSGGTWNAFARTSDGKVWAWGKNGSGQLGDGTTTNACLPEVILQP